MSTQRFYIESFKLTQCTVPKYWGVNYQPPGQDNAAPPFIGADLTVTQPANGFCATFSTIASAVAGELIGFITINVL